MKTIRLKPAIYITEGVWGGLICLAILGIIGSLINLKGAVLVCVIILFLASFAVIFHIKIYLINFFLKRCKYHFEFVSVLAQLELTEDVTIDWGEQNILLPGKASFQTQDFLLDNKLATEFKTTGNEYWKGGRATLTFEEKGLIYDNTIFEWDKIIRWKIIRENRDSAGTMEICYENGQNEKKLIVNLDDFEIDKIDFLLLLTHFKAKHAENLIPYTLQR